MAEYREIPAPPSLRLEVECGWQLRQPGGAGTHLQRVLPDGCMDLRRRPAGDIRHGPA
ncbi:DUF6597 domain-containing transcriptional factor [Pseudonocardia asaccharolytica]|uniref:Uncharacterized protein n=1 Tax=Pseudonocardia asaccharolytica DSM 44247 = NBRC 16224 TaxID=1123024 RepID=A0A511D4T0_9PSEU|nr:DUF6597 domain-containing transcriptional factor [Pseudonocardia asaccharolytica]GEL19667.1 hypothetical protein PA7_35040 [Pseudonocardia asaccharolytica DSM 44247 = NBRC 16224]